MSETKIIDVNKELFKCKVDSFSNPFWREGEKIMTCTLNSGKTGVLYSKNRKVYFEMGRNVFILKTDRILALLLTTQELLESN